MSAHTSTAASASADDATQNPDNSGPRVVRAAHMPAEAPHVPVVIVGAGACGLTAAVRLRDAGLDCVLLERDSMASGSTALSSGFIPAAGTRLQKSLGIEDSSEAFAQDIQAKAHGEAAPDLVRAYSQAVGPAIDALEQHGIGFEFAENEHEILEFTWKQRVGARASAFGQLQYSIDSTGFVSTGLANDGVFQLTRHKKFSSMSCDLAAIGPLPIGSSLRLQIV